MSIDNWQKAELGKVLKVISGQHVLANAVTDENSGTPYLTGPADFPDGTIHVTKFVTAPGVLCKAGDILLTVKGSGVGKSVVADREYCISRQLMALRPLEADSDFIYQVVKNTASGLNGISAGTIPGITKHDVESWPILLPPLPEQKKIAEILSCWDRAIEKLDTLSLRLAKLRLGLIQNLVFGKVRLTPKVKNITQASRYFSIPQDWTVKKIADVAKEYSERNNVESNPPVLSCTKNRGLVESKVYFGKQIYSDDLSNYKLAPKHTFVYATNHIEEGSIGYQSHFDNALVSPIYTVFKTKDSIHDGFLFRLLKTETFRHIFQASTNSSVNRRGSLRWSDFSQIEIPVPSKDEQIAISQVVDSCDKEIEEVLLLRARVTKQKAALMQQLLTGKTRVRVS